VSQDGSVALGRWVLVSDLTLACVVVDLRLNAIPTVIVVAMLSPLGGIRVQEHVRGFHRRLYAPIKCTPIELGDLSPRRYVTGLDAPAVTHAAQLSGIRTFGPRPLSWRSALNRSRRATATITAGARQSATRVPIRRREQGRWGPCGAAASGCDDSC